MEKWKRKVIKYLFAILRAISTLMLWGFFFTILKYKRDTMDNARRNFYILKTSKNVESTGLTRVGYYDQQNIR